MFVFVMFFANIALVVGAWLSTMMHMSRNMSQRILVNFDAPVRFQWFLFFSGPRNSHGWHEFLNLRALFARVLVGGPETGPTPKPPTGQSWWPS